VPWAYGSDSCLKYTFIMAVQNSIQKLYWKM